MFAKSEVAAKLDAEIISLLDKLKSIPDKKSQDYTTIVEQLSKLNKLKAEEAPKRVSPDTVLVVAANIFGILWLARYERENVIRSRSALGFVLKPRGG